MDWLSDKARPQKLFFFSRQVLVRVDWDSLQVCPGELTCLSCVKQVSTKWKAMRFHNLTLLSFLLALQVILVQGKKEAINRHVSKAKRDERQTPNKTKTKQKGQRHLPNGQFISTNQANCKWTVTEQEQGIALMVECSQGNAIFSCVFTGNPTSCIELNQKRTYWKQIGQSLRSQKAICEDSKSVLKTKVCRKNFPESNLKLMNSTLIRNKPSSQEQRKKTTATNAIIMEANQMKPSPTNEHTKVNDSSPLEASETQPMTTQNPLCVEDSDLVTPNKVALEYCGETWLFLCEIFIAVAQSTSC